jgi:hypothetical protein
MNTSSPEGFNLVLGSTGPAVDDAGQVQLVTQVFASW